MKTLASVSVASVILFATLILSACGSSSHASVPTAGTLSGNWQINMLQQFPDQSQLRTLSVTGFLSRSGNNITGSVQGPTILSSNQQVLNCGGIATLSGIVNGQSVTFTEDIGGTLYTFTGTISLDNKSMSGDFQAPGGACFTTPTTGTFNAFQIPQLNGNFTGTLGSLYMQILDGTTAAVPVAVSGSFTQSDNVDASSATLTGTMTAVGYPCFSTVTMTGTVSGQNVYMDIYNYNGNFIGTLGAPPASPTAGGAPANIMVGASGVSLIGMGNGLNGLFLGITAGGTTSGPCPTIGPTNQSIDNASVNLTIQ